MQKTAPTLPRILTMVAFALSCFGLLIFLWLTFGGPIPLQPKGYRVQVAFPDAIQLASQVDVRISGVKVGTVVEEEAEPATNRTLATLEMDPRYAPIPADTRAVLRRKTLVGETYVELTAGSRGAPMVADGGRLSDRNVQDAVDLDEILDTFDPYTRAMFRTWQRELGRGVRTRGTDLNDALGNLPAFVESGGDLAEVLDASREDVRRFVRDTGVVFEAATEREQRLERLITAGDDVFSAIASEREAFADIWQIFPTFLDESKLTAARLEGFATKARPVVAELRPAMGDLRRTLPDLADLGPDLRRYFRRSDPLLTVNRRALPAGTEVFRELRPVFVELGPFLEQLNPILHYVGEQSWYLADMLGNLGAATQARVTNPTGGHQGHYLRQFGVTGAETAAIWPNRLASNRGNTYLQGYGGPFSPQGVKYGVSGNWDCSNAGGEKEADASPGCWNLDPKQFQGRLQKYPNVRAADYRK